MSWDDLEPRAMPGRSFGVLSAQDVSVHHGPVVAVRQANLAVGPGEMVAVTGPAGAGKTSLLSALAGVKAPATGSVTFDDGELHDRDDAVARGIVLIPQGNSLVQILTALENVLVALVARGVDETNPFDAAEDTMQDALRALAEVGLDEAAHQRIEELSGGQQQRVAVARGIALRGVVVIADEPTSELDAANRTRVMTLLRAEASRGAAVVVATHDPDAADLCDAELRLDEGTLQPVRDQR